MIVDFLIRGLGILPRPLFFLFARYVIRILSLNLKFEGSPQFLQISFLRDTG